jgi:hypothetical protein
MYKIQGNKLRNKSCFLLMQCKSLEKRYKCVNLHVFWRDTEHSSQNWYCPAKSRRLRFLILWLRKNGDIGVPNRICRNTGTEIYKIHKNEIVPGKSGRLCILSVHTEVSCPTHLFATLCLTVAWPLYPLACFLTLFPCPIFTPFPNWSGQDSTWCDRFLHLQLIFQTRLIHKPHDGGSTHIWNVSLLQRDCAVLYPRRLIIFKRLMFLLVLLRDWCVSVCCSMVSSFGRTTEPLRRSSRWTASHVLCPV